jgi:transglutaminase-like putative cysteine protease
MRFPRRRFLQLAGVSAAALVGAGSALAGRAPSAPGAPATSAAVSQDAIDALASSLDCDLDRIFRFVADEIWYEPYAGALRGAGGTLESRAGNSVDQALLLDSLLRASFMDTRFVVGSLDAAAEPTLLASLTLDRDTARARAGAIAAEPLPGGPPAPAFSSPLPPELQEIADLAPELSAAATSWTSARLDAGVATIVAELQAAGIEVAPPEVALPALERERHVWLQVARGSDWIDLDPTLVGAQPGTPSGTPPASRSRRFPTTFAIRSASWSRQRSSMATP